MLLALRLALAALVVSTGVMHFTRPRGFERIVPRYLPAPRALVYVSGFFELLGGVGLLAPVTQRLAAWGLIALFIAVFPANVEMAVNRARFKRAPRPWMLWARLPLQAVLIAWAYLLTR